MIVLREATQRDCPFLSSLFYNSKYGCFFPEGNRAPAHLEEEFADFQKMHNYIVSDTLRRNSANIGWLLYETQGSVCRLHRLVMRADLMGTGLGYSAYEVFLSHLDDEVRTIRVSVHNRNQHALDFFTRCGFTPTAEEEWYEINDESVRHVVMSCARPRKHVFDIE